MAITHETVALSGVRLRVASLGTGPLVVLLHGFPDSGGTWHHQIGPLAEAGFRVVAPDLRGYGESDKPSGLAAYRLDALAQDVIELIAAMGETTARVVGHDWGGMIAWHTALRHPGAIDKLAILNAPPPWRFLGRPLPIDQLARSWYVYAFQAPWLPEAALGAFDFLSLRAMLPREAARAGAIDAAETQRMIDALAAPGALTAALNYYRALPVFGAFDAARQADHLPIPLLVLWGEKDPHLAPALAEVDARRAPHARVVRFPEAGHWVHLDAPDRVTALLLEFLTEAR